MRTSAKHLDAERKLGGILVFLMWPFMALFVANNVIVGFGLAALAALAVARVTRYAADWWDHIH